MSQHRHRQDIDAPDVIFAPSPTPVNSDSLSIIRTEVAVKARSPAPIPIYFSSKNFRQDANAIHPKPDKKKEKQLISCDDSVGELSFEDGLGEYDDVATSRSDEKEQPAAPADVTVAAASVEIVEPAEKQQQPTASDLQPAALDLDFDEEKQLQLDADAAVAAAPDEYPAMEDTLPSPTRPLRVEKRTISPARSTSSPQRDRPKKRVHFAPKLTEVLHYDINDEPMTIAEESRRELLRRCPQIVVIDDVDDDEEDDNVDSDDEEDDPNFVPAAMHDSDDSDDEKITVPVAARRRATPGTPASRLPAAVDVDEEKDEEKQEEPAPAVVVSKSKKPTKARKPASKTTVPRREGIVEERRRQLLREIALRRGDAPKPKREKKPEPKPEPVVDTHGKKWTKKELKQLAEAYITFGRKPTLLTRCVPTRTYVQVYHYVEHHPDHIAIFEQYHQQEVDAQNARHARQEAAFKLPQWPPQERRQEPAKPKYIPQTDEEIERIARLRERAAAGELLPEYLFEEPEDIDDDEKARRAASIAASPPQAPFEPRGGDLFLPRFAVPEWYALQRWRHNGKFAAYKFLQSQECSMWERRLEAQERGLRLVGEVIHRVSRHQRGLDLLEDDETEIETTAVPPPTSESLPPKTVRINKSTGKPLSQEEIDARKAAVAATAAASDADEEVKQDGGAMTSAASTKKKSKSKKEAFGRLSVPGLKNSKLWKDILAKITTIELASEKLKAFSADPEIARILDRASKPGPFLAKCPTLTCFFRHEARRRRILRCGFLRRDFLFVGSR